MDRDGVQCDGRNERARTGRNRRRLPPRAAPPLLRPPAQTPDLPAVSGARDKAAADQPADALQLANVRAVDVAAAAARIKVSAADLEQTRVLWLPTVAFGSDYFRHDGIVQDATSGDVQDDSHQGAVSPDRL